MKVRSAKGVSVHVGADHLDSVHYGGFKATALSARPDALYMKTFAESRGFRARAIIGRAATAEAVREALEKAAGEVKPGDTFLLTYSGHGGVIVANNASKAVVRRLKAGTRYEIRGLPRRLELAAGWALYDRIMLNVEFDKPLQLFESGVRVVVVADCCFSATSFLGPDVFTGTFPLKRRSSNKTSLMELPPEALLRLYLKKRRFYDGVLRSAARSAAAKSPPRVSGIFLSSSGRGREAHNYRDGHAAVFTQALIVALLTRHARDYATLIRTAATAVKTVIKSQRPALFTFGTGVSIADSPPFRI